MVDLTCSKRYAQPGIGTLRFRVWCCGLLLVLMMGGAHAATCTSAAGANNWNTVGTWSCGHVPANGDDVVIAATSTTTLNANSNSLLSLTVNGVLIIASNLNVNSNAAAPLTINSGGTVTIGNNGTARAMVVTGDITVAGTFSIGATAATHTLTAGGDIINTGTINFAPSGTRLCNVTFNNNGNQTVSGAGAYTFNLITLNMGATNANVLDMQSNMTVPSPFLTITNGTYKHSNTSNITPWTAAVTIPASGGFWLNGAATVTTTGFNVSVTGLLRISAGTMTIGNANTIQMLLNNASTFQMDGGTLNVTGGLDSAATNSTGTFTMSAGTINVQTISNGTPTSFMLGSGTTFNMSGGTIVLVNGDNTTNDLELRSGTVNVTGGTMQIGSGATSAANQFLITNGSGASFTVWNLTLAAGVARTITLGSAVNVLNSLTIQANNTLDGGGFAINVGDATGNATPGIGNWTNNGAYTTGTSTVSFVGPGAAAIGGTVATTFQNLTINKSAATNTVTVSTSPTVNATLTFTSGQIVTGANAVIVATTGTIATPSANSYVVGNFQKNYSAGANLSYSASNDFPIGDTTNYTPVNISAGTTTTAGSLTVSTLTPDHPQVTTPIASTGIDGTKSVNRYWRFNNSGITVGTAISATFTFVAGDVDAGATTANFIVQRYDGTNWNPTTLVAANALNTQASNITPLAAGNNDFAIGEPLSGFTGGTPGAFNAFETSTPANAILGRIYTKVVGAAITLQVVAVNAGRTGVNAVYNTNPITVALLDARDNTGAITAATDCRSTWTTVISTQSLSPAWTNGRSNNITITTPVNAWRDVRVKVTQGANSGCSTDRFSIRPTAFTITSTNATNNNSSGAPAFKTGQSFNLTAVTGLTGYDNGLGATLASPQLIPLIDNTQVAVSVGMTAGSISGSFGAASGGTATGNTFTYSEVGNFGLNGSIATNAFAVYDNVFTAVDQPAAILGDCTADFSNTLVGGKYGCNFGNTAIPQTTGSSGFGRFIPDHFALTGAGTMTAACSTATAFTYMGQSMSFSGIKIEARNSANVITRNYAGAYVKLNPATFGSLGLGARDSGGAGTNLTARVDPGGTSSGGWAAGALSSPPLSVTAFSIDRANPDNPDGPYNATAVGIAPTDSDGVTMQTSDFNMDVDASGTNDHAQIGGGATVWRFGRLRVSSAQGSELLALTVPMQTEYWSSFGFAVNGDDSCTTLLQNNIVMSNYLQNLVPPNCKTAFAAGMVSFSSGVASPTLAAPGSGVTGSVDLRVRLSSSSAVGNYCASVGAGTQTATAIAPLSYLLGRWNDIDNDGNGNTAYDDDPTARANFGIYGAQVPNNFIYFRENY